MHMLRLLFVLLIFSFVKPTSGQQLHVILSDLSAYKGHTLYLKVYNNETDDLLSYQTTLIEDNVDFVFGQAALNDTYRLDFWIDVDGDGQYSAPPRDYAWRETVTIESDIHRFNWHFTDAFTDIQWKKTLTIRLNKFENFAGQTVHARVYNKQMFVVQQLAERKIEKTDNYLYFEGLDARDVFDIEFFLDVNKNGKYDSPPTDYAWKIGGKDADDDGDGIPDACYGIDDDCDGSVDFSFTDTFTYIGWSEHFRIDFVGADPTLGGDFYLKLMDTSKTHRKKVDYFLHVKKFDGQSVYQPMSANSSASTFEASWAIDTNGDGLIGEDEPSGVQQIQSQQYGVLPLEISSSSSSTGVQYPYTLGLGADLKSFGNDKVIRILKKKLPPPLDDDDDGDGFGTFSYAGNFITGVSYAPLIINDVKQGDYELLFFEDLNKDGNFNPASEAAYKKEIRIDRFHTVVEIDRSQPISEIPNVLTVRIEDSNTNAPNQPNVLHTRVYQRGSNPLYEDPHQEGTNPLYQKTELYFGGMDPHTSYEIYFLNDVNQNGIDDDGERKWKIGGLDPDDDGDGIPDVCYGIDTDCDDTEDVRPPGKTEDISWPHYESIRYSAIPASYLKKNLITWISDANKPTKIKDVTIDEIEGTELTSSRNDLLFERGDRINFFIDIDEDGWFTPGKDVAYSSPIGDLDADGLPDLALAELRPLDNPVINGFVKVNFEGFTDLQSMKLHIRMLDKASPTLLRSYEILENVPNEFSTILYGTKPNHSYELLGGSTELEESFSYDFRNRDDMFYKPDISGSSIFEEVTVTPEDFRASDSINWTLPVQLSMTNFSKKGYDHYMARMKAREKANKTACKTQPFSIYGDSINTLLTGFEYGKEYELLVWIDSDGNSIYEEENDPSWIREFTYSPDIDKTILLDANESTRGLFWNYDLLLFLHNMDPHAGQYMQFFVRPEGTYTNVDMIQLTAPGANFSIYSEDELVQNNSYSIDFFADHNGNTQYDQPPVDHSWRIPTGTVNGDVEIHFFHNTNFTPIEESSNAVNESRTQLRLYPNPTLDYLNVKTSHSINRASIVDETGKVVKIIESLKSGPISLKDIQPGSYLFVCESEGRIEVQKFMKK